MPKVYASSINKIPPRASSNTSRVFMMVVCLSRPTKSIRSTSKNLGLRNNPSSWYALAKRRATAVLPVPGLPTNTIWGAFCRSVPAKPGGKTGPPRRPDAGGIRESRKSQISVLRRKPRTCDLTCSNPTMELNKSSTRSRFAAAGAMVCVIMAPPVRASRTTLLLRFLMASNIMASACPGCSEKAISNSFGSIPAVYKAWG
mmetsp:Transcript_21016/g.29212  ORF Transcript_21016/g.29212 Transcript_21016/m.29212 type:complete len:201 (-) Transcript_21016:610-1212(-)